MKNMLYQIPTFIRRFCYIVLGGLDTILKRKNFLVILCYHSISEDGWAYSVSPKNLEAQMRYMLTQYSPIILAEVLTEGLKKPSFAVTFDDGYENIYETRSLFSKLGIRPTVFALTDPTHVNRKILRTKLPLLPPAKLHSLKQFGWEIGSHGKTHEILDTIDSKSLDEQIAAPMQSFSYPKGRYSKKVVEAVRRAGYTIGVSMDDHLITKHSNPLTLPRVGVANSHSLTEFKVLASPSVVAFRGLMKFFVHFLHV